MSAQGQELIDTRALLDAREAEWFVTLGEFVSLRAYELDGHASVVHWLIDQCHMNRSTAKEKARVALELRRRPVVNAAFVDGTLSYSKARAFTRLSGLHDDRDAALIKEYGAESADVIERMVRWWNLRNSDDDGAEPDPYDQPRVRFHPGFSGANGRIIIDGANEDLQRFMNLLDAYGSFLYFTAQQASERSGAAEASVKPPGDEASVKPVAEEASVKPGASEASVKPMVLRADDADEPAEWIHDALGVPQPEWRPLTASAEEASVEPPRSLAQRRFDWLYDLIEEVALARADQLDPDRAAVAVTVPYESLVGPATAAKYGIVEGGPVPTGQAVRRVCCDAGISRMVVKGQSEILDVGRQTRTWNRAQRRAIRARHNHQCAVRGCDRRITQIHHLVFWRNGGRTCIENGVPLCARHHHMVHDQGWAITWDVESGVTAFTGPAGQALYTEADPFLVTPPGFEAA